MPELIVQRSRGFPPNLYLQVPFTTMVKFGVKRGSTLLCHLNRGLDAKGGVISTIDKRVHCSVSIRDGRFYLPPDLVASKGLTGVEYIEVTLEKLLKPDKNEEEISSGQKIEKTAK